MCRPGRDLRSLAKADDADWWLLAAADEEAAAIASGAVEVGPTVVALPVIVTVPLPYGTAPSAQVALVGVPTTP